MRTPLDKNDHTELDDTELLTGKSIQHYITMIGKLQWLVTLRGGLGWGWGVGGVDIHANVITMSRFMSALRNGHLERLQRSLWICPEDEALFNQIQNRGT